MNPNKLFTSHEAAVLLQMDPSSIVKWVNDGMLPAFRTPGKHRRIRAADLHAFLIEHDMFVPDELRGSRRVLWADHDSSALAAMAKAMRAHKDQVELVTCTTGIEALLRVGAERPEVLILDTQLPDLQGLEALRRLKGSKETREIEVVLLAGRAGGELERKVRELGGKAVLTRPLSPAQLIEVVTGRSAQG